MQHETHKCSGQWHFHNETKKKNTKYKRHFPPQVRNEWRNAKDCAHGAANEQGQASCCGSRCPRRCDKGPSKRPKKRPKKRPNQSLLRDKEKLFAEEAAARARAHTHTHTHTHMRACMHARMHGCTLTCSLTRVRASSLSPPRSPSSLSIFPLKY